MMGLAFCGVFLIGMLCGFVAFLAVAVYAEAKTRVSNIVQYDDNAGIPCV